VKSVAIIFILVLMLQWQLKTFHSLTPEEFYAIMRLRQEVFIVEQNCAYLDADGKDIHCHHLSGFNNEGELVAYSRIVPPGISYDEPSIGRVITSLKERRGGYGKELMEKAIEETIRLYGNTAIRIGAQQYLKRFYGSFGFVQQGEPYMEDGIPHIIMLKAP
jgi:ElaA protein